jgi:hypothetical protein
MEDMLHIIRTICSDFDLAIVNESAEVISADTARQLHHVHSYGVAELRASIICHFLHELWLIEVDKIFKVFGSHGLVSISSIHDRVESMSSRFRPSAMMPSRSIMSWIKDALKAKAHHQATISFIQWKQLLVACPLIMEEYAA